MVLVKKIAITLKVSCDVIVEVPEDSPLLNVRSEIALHGDQSGTWSDGRYPYSTELFHDGAAGIARAAVDSALFRVISDEFEAKVGLKKACSCRGIKTRNAVIDKARKVVEFHRPGSYVAHAGRVETSDPFDLIEAYRKLCETEN